ncbi:serine-threonine protein phosphatase, putative, partial [Bodo saltans]
MEEDGSKVQQSKRSRRRGAKTARPFSTGGHGNAAAAVSSAAVGSRPSTGGDASEGSTGSGNKAWKKKHRWHNEQSSSATARGGSVSSNNVTPAKAHHHQNAGASSETESHHKDPAVTTTTATRRTGTVTINSSVRCVDPSGFLSTKSLKDLLRNNAVTATEADTPCLGPAAAPNCVVNSLQAREDSAKVVSPMLAFSLDSIATPNTFAALKDPPVAEGGSHDESHRSVSGMPSSGSRQDLAGSGDDILPAMSVESPYHYLQRNYNAEAEMFEFYETPEARATFLDKCYMLCTRATEILKEESLMACVYAPVYVFGDIHGNFADLSYFLRSVLAFNDIHLSPCNILCLGDYVDRGPFSLECVMVLLALKIEAPHKVTLLRGNHEDRVVCGDRRTYGSDCFLAQCQTIFGPVEGMKLFRAVTAVFQHLPLAAEIVVSNAPNRQHKPQQQIQDEDVLDPIPQPRGSSTTQWKRATDQRHKSHVERILCTHGGIPRFSAPPREKDMLAFLRSPEFPRLLTLFPNNPLVRDDPEAQLDGLDQAVLQQAWYVMFDLMWSDPTHDDNGPNINEWGFGINMRGNNVVSFSSVA